MIQILDNALTSLQAGVCALELYGEDHPFVKKQFSTSAELLADILARAGEVRVGLLDDRVMLSDEAMPSSAELERTLFTWLRNHEVDGIVLRAGVTEKELRDFAAFLSSREEQPLFKSRHISLAVIACGQPDTSDRRFEDVELAHVGAKHMPGLHSLWDRMLQGQESDDAHLMGIAADLAHAATESRSAMLPLASLKRHDEYTFVHTINVAMLASALAEAVGVSGQTLHDITTAALMHDIGKQLIPQGMLNKAGKLTKEEFRLVQSHPSLGANLLLARKDLPDIATIVTYEHHMQLAGGGYPVLSRPRKIHFASQIVQVADIFDALRTDRPYRAAMTRNEALEVMSRSAGPSFDPALFDVFIDRVVGRTEENTVEPADEPQLVAV